MERVDSVLIPNPRPAAHGCNACELADGGIAVCWFAGTREGVEDQRVLVSTSADGSTWSQPDVLVDHFAHDADRWVPEVAALVQTESDELWAVFSAAPISSFIYREDRDAYLRDLNQARLFQARISWPAASKASRRAADGAGPSMGQPLEIPSRLPMILQGKALPVPGGGWLIQCNSRDSEGRHAASLFEGEPGGAWRETRHLTTIPGCLEASTAFFADGRILTYARYSGYGGHIWRSESTTDTSELSEPVQTTLRNPHSGIDIAATADDRMLIVYNDSYRLRTPLTLGLSDDRGRTFRCHDIEYEAGEFSYPKLFCRSDGSWFLFYTHQRKRIACFAFDLEFFADGRPTVGLSPRLHDPATDRSAP